LDSFGFDLRPSLNCVDKVVGLCARLPVALSKLDSPEVTTSGFGFRSGDSSGVDSFSGAENWKGLLLVIMVLVSVGLIAE
jgi:hypothetical protein